MNTEKYKLDAIEFDQDEWIFFQTIHYIRSKHRDNYRIFEVGSGRAGLIYGLSVEFKRFLKKVISIDVENQVSPPDKLFYEKKTAFTTIYNNGCELVDSFEADATLPNVVNSVLEFFDSNKISLFIVEYLKDDKYMDSLFDLYANLFDENTVIVYKYIYKSKESLNYFDKISADRKSIKFKNNLSSGIII